jgi:hypothetical protein
VQATEVAALQDGAAWLQDVIQRHRADATRLLDFAHAAQYIAGIGQLMQEARTSAVKLLQEQLHTLKHDGPTGVLKEMQQLQGLAASAEMSEKVRYSRKREQHMRYPHYPAQGWPIGSSMAENGQ